MLNFCLAVRLLVYGALHALLRYSLDQFPGADVVEVVLIHFLLWAVTCVLNGGNVLASKLERVWEELLALKL